MFKLYGIGSGFKVYRFSNVPMLQLQVLNWPMFIVLYSGYLVGAQPVFVRLAYWLLQLIFNGA